VPSSLTVTNSTFSGNSADFDGGVSNDSGMATLKNTIVANSPAGGDCAIFSGGTITDGGYNPSSDDTCGFSKANNSQAGTEEDPLDPLLRPLADNGGPTKTHALRRLSPAIDQGKAFRATTDQRGEPRRIDFLGIPNAPGAKAATSEPTSVRGRADTRRAVATP
jgi:hypothetical protein